MEKVDLMYVLVESREEGLVSTLMNYLFTTPIGMLVLYNPPVVMKWHFFKKKRK